MTMSRWVALLIGLGFNDYPTDSLMQKKCAQQQLGGFFDSLIKKILVNLPPIGGGSHS
jgi:hypothetical protein